MKKSRATLPFRFLRGLYRLLTNGAFVLAVLVLLAFNAATLTLPAVNAGVSDLFFAATGMETLAQKNRKATLAAQEKIAQLKDQAAQLEAGKAAALAENARIAGLIGDRLARLSARTEKLDTLRLDTLAGRAVPLWGLSLDRALAAYEHQAACATMGDLAALAAAAGKTEPPAAPPALCDRPVPGADAIWLSVKTDPQGAWDSARSALDALPGPKVKLPQPQFQSWWGATLATMSRWYPAAQ